MQKLECGICRTPFKKEYFENDPIANELFNNNNNQNRNINILSLIQNIQSNNRNNREILYSQILNSNSNRNNNLNVIITDNNNRNIMNQNNNINNYILNRNNIRINRISINEEVIFCGLFILSFQPSKSYCMVSFFLNIFFCGLGTILIGLNKKSLFYTLVGIIQCYCFFFFLIYLISLDNKKIFGIPPNKFFYIYFKFLSIAFYISSLYIAIFRNFLFFNLRKINFNEKKERGLLIYFLNISVQGTGTLLVGIINLTKEEICWEKIKYIIYGIIQLGGYILTIYGISLINNKNIRFDNILILIVGAASFAFSLYTSYSYYKKITS